MQAGGTQHAPSGANFTTTGRDDGAYNELAGSNSRLLDAVRCEGRERPHGAASALACSACQCSHAHVQHDGRPCCSSCGDARIHPTCAPAPAAHTGPGLLHDQPHVTGAPVAAARSLVRRPRVSAGEDGAAAAAAARCTGGRLWACTHAPHCMLHAGARCTPAAAMPPRTLRPRCCSSYSTCLPGELHP